MALPNFVSRQVQKARRFFLHLNAPPNGPLALVCGGCERVHPDYQIQRSDFPFHCIEVIAEGEGEALLAHQSFPLHPGVVFAYGPGIPHTLRTSRQKPLLKYYIDFTGQPASHLLHTSGLRPGSFLQVTPVEEIVSLLDALQRDAASDHPVAEELALAQLRVLLLKIRERSCTPSQPHSRSLASYLRARQLLEQNALLWRSADEAAAHCGMSPEHLSRLFAKHGHTSPYKLLLRIKMGRAAELLLDSGLKVHEVASEMAFADASHFSKAFKRFYGDSPERFLRRMGTRTIPPPEIDS